MATYYPGDQLEPWRRLIRIQQLLHERADGWTAAELRAQLGDGAPNLRTIQRDIAALRDMALDAGHDEEILQPRRGRYSLPPGVYPFNPIELSLHEARALLFALRLLLHNTGGEDPDALAALDKIGAAFPGAVAQQAGAVLRPFAASKPGETREARERLEVLHKMTEAWVSSRTVSLWYRAPGKRPKTIEFDPHILSPGPNNAVTYVTGYSHNQEHRDIRTLVLSRIGSVTLLSKRFEPPDVGTLAERMSRSWGGVIVGDETYEVVLEFTPEAAVRARESHPVPGRRLSDIPGGGVRMEMTLASLLDFVPFVLSWGPDVTVVSPPELRESVAAQLRLAAKNYA